MNLKVPRTYEFVDNIDDFQIVKETGEHYIVNCPYCATKYKPNPEDFYPKLYIHKEKRVGYCFRCNTVVIVQDTEPNLDYYMNSVVPKFPSLQHVEFPTVRWDDFHIRYLEERSPYVFELMRHYNIHIYPHKDGIAFPQIINSRIVGYQVRRIRSTPKYYNYGERTLYSPTGLTLDITQTITLVEGAFDSLGALYLGFPNPIAIMGSRLSKIQIQLLRMMAPQRVVVGLDEEELSKNLVKMITDNVPTVFDTEIVSAAPYKDLDEKAKFLYLNRGEGRPV